MLKGFLLVVAAIHGLFMLFELFPWRMPVLLGKASTKLPAGQHFTPEQEHLVAGIVHNAGIYNAIIFGGLVWAASTTPIPLDAARVLCAGAALAGAFGTVTLKSKFTAVQAAAGLIGLWLCR